MEIDELKRRQNELINMIDALKENEKQNKDTPKIKHDKNLELEYMKDKQRLTCGTQ